MSKRPDAEECRIIRDILPSYADKLTSDVSNAIIEEHLKTCEDCKAALDEMLSDESRRSERIRKEEKAYLRHINMKRKRPIIFGALLIGLAVWLVYLFVPGAIGDERLTREQIASITEQLEARGEYLYDDYFPGKVFDDILIYGMDREKDRILIYADVSEGHFAKVNGKAYDVGGSSGSVVMHGKVDGSDITIDGVVYPKDGNLLAESLRELFPLRYYLRMMVWGGGYTGNYRESKLKEKVYKEWGIEVSEDLLQIDEENMKYTITRFDDTIGNDEVIEEGSLEQLP